jgi:hypothetical protein
VRDALPSVSREAGCACLPDGWAGDDCTDSSMQSRGRTSNRQTPTGAAGTCGELNIVTFTGVDAILPKSYSGVTLTVNGSGLGSQAACQRVCQRGSDVSGRPNLERSRLLGRWATWLSLCGATVFLAACSCSPPDQPCVEWAKEGANYVVELVSPVDFSTLAPPTTRTSCGATFDLTTGSSVPLAVSARRDPDGECFKCYWLTARVTTAPVGSLTDLSAASTVNWSEPELEAAHVATIGSCIGEWVFGIKPLRGQASTTPTTTAAYRTFSASDLASCKMAGLDSAVSGPNCIDGWFVRVRDKDGLLVSQ